MLMNLRIAMRDFDRAGLWCIPASRVETEESLPNSVIVGSRHSRPFHERFWTAHQTHPPPRCESGKPCSQKWESRNSLSGVVILTLIRYRGGIRTWDGGSRENCLAPISSDRNGCCTFLFFSENLGTGEQGTFDQFQGPTGNDTC